MYAVIATGGKQYRVQQDDVIDIERIEGDAGKKITFTEVLALGDGDKIQCGTPLIESAKISAEIIEQFRGKKLTVFKMKRRKGYRKKHGHRQELTKVKIGKISLPGTAKATAAKSADKAAPAKEAKPKAASKASDKKADK